jgi:hypothetical protein
VFHVSEVLHFIFRIAFASEGIFSFSESELVYSLQDDGHQMRNGDSGFSDEDFLMCVFTALENGPEILVRNLSELDVQVCWATCQRIHPRLLQLTRRLLSHLLRPSESLASSMLPQFARIVVAEDLHTLLRAWLKKPELNIH